MNREPPILNFLQSPSWRLFLGQWWRNQGKPGPRVAGEWSYMGVSKNNGTPKPSILIGFSLIFTIHFGGFTPIFGSTNIHMLVYYSRCIPKWKSRSPKKTRCQSTLRIEILQNLMQTCTTCFANKWTCSTSGMICWTCLRRSVVHAKLFFFAKNVFFVPSFWMTLFKVKWPNCRTCVWNAGRHSVTARKKTKADPRWPVKPNALAL